MLVMGRLGTDEGIDPFQKSISPRRELESLLSNITDIQTRTILRKCWELGYEHVEEVMTDLEKAMSDKTVGVGGCDDNVDDAMSELLRRFQNSL